MSECEVNVTSGVGMDTGKPIVTIELKGISVTMSAGDARALALNILQGAEAAIQDLNFYTFSTDELDLGHKKSAALLSEFRKFREKREL